MHRLFKPVLFTLVCVSAGFAILSLLFADGVTHETSFEINADPSTVWSVFTDPAELSEWMFGLAEIKEIEGRYGQEGALIDFIYRNENGAESRLRERITKIDHGKRFDFTGENEQFTMNGSVIFEKTEEGTKVTQEITHIGKTWYWKALAPMMESVFRTSSEGLYSNLKRHVESSG